MRNLIYSLVILCCLLLIGCQVDNNDTIPQQPKSNRASTLDKKDLKQIDDILDSLSSLDNIISFSISENNENIKTVYYKNVQEDFKNNVFSVTKSITSMLVGIAIDEGYFTGVNQTIGEFISADEFNLSEEQMSISIKDILTMTMGLYWSSNLTSEYHSLKGSSNTLNLILDRKIAYKPGTTFNYSDGAAHMMSIIFTKATGKTLHEYAIEKIFIPLGIENTKWNADSDGNNYGGFDLFLSNEDMIKIGNLMKNNGQFNGIQIVSKSWIEASTFPTVKTGSSASHNNYYGYYWWVGDIDNIALYAAIGHGGQFIYVVPEFDLVIAASCYGATSDKVADKSFTAVRNAIVRKIIPLYVNKEN